MNNLYILVLLSTLLTACGGGGGGSSESSAAIPADSQPTNPSATPVLAQPAVTEFRLQESQPIESGPIIVSAVQATSEIDVPKGFALKSEATFNLKITLSEDDDQPAYLSLCSDYVHHEDGSYSINYDSCLLRTSIRDNNFETVITVTNDTRGLVAALWFMDGTKEPLFNDWRF